MLAQLAEPIRIITKSHSLGIAGAALLLGVLHNEDKRCSVRVVQHYTRAELDALLHEEYPAFVLIDCVEEGYKKLKNALFISSGEIYALLPLNAKKYAHILVAGYYADYIESGILDVPDPVLQDALQSGFFVVPEPHTEITPSFFEGLACSSDGTLKNLLDFSAVINACARTGRAPCAISALLHDIRAQEEAVRVLAEYRHEVTNALKWCKSEQSSGVSIVHMKDYVASYLTGSVAQHLVQQAKEKSLVLVLAYAPDGLVRVSLRGKKEGLNLLKLLRQMYEGVNGECGGVGHAAGGMFVRADEEKFLSAARNVMERAFAEEAV